MHFNWEIPVGTIVLIVSQFIVGLMGLMRFFSAIEKSIDARFTEIKMSINAMKDGDMRELQGRVKRLETGSDEWTRELRDRTHDQANLIQGLTLEIDRLKRPGHYPEKA